MSKGYLSISSRNPDCLCPINSLKYWLLIQYKKLFCLLLGVEEYHVKPGNYSVHES